LISRSNKNKKRSRKIFTNVLPKAQVSKKYTAADLTVGERRRSRLEHYQNTGVKTTEMMDKALEGALGLQAMLLARNWVSEQKAPGKKRKYPPRTRKKEEIRKLN
jgi:hypothetical protein